jgi:hypothetical protein
MPNALAATLSTTILRPIATLALAVALAAPLAVSGNAEAQLGRQLPSPVSAAQLESILREAGLPDTTKDAALPLHEGYFARFRDFEKREVDPMLAKQNDSPFALSRSVEDARKDADARRRVFQRAAQLDGQLADELESVLPASDAWRAQKVRMALTRRRCAAVAPTFGFSGKPLEYTLRGAPILAKIDPESLTIVNTALDAYESELTRQLERYAEASFARIVKSAELMQELGVGEAPAQADAGDGAPTEDSPTGKWMESMREVSRRASEDTTKIVNRIRALHREGLMQVMPLMKPEEARALRDHLAAANYPGLRVKSEFDAVYATAVKMRADGELERSKWTDAQALAEANELATRPIAMSLMELTDESRGEGDFGVIIIDGASAQGDDATRAKAERLRKDYASADSANAAALRALLGIAEPEMQTARGGRAGLAMEAIEGIQFEGAAVMVGGVGGNDMVVLSSDDLGDAGLMFSSVMGGAGGRVAKPMSRAELDDLAKALGFDATSRAVFDEIVARAAEARNTAEKELAPPAPQFNVEGEAGVAIGIQIAGDGEAALFDPGDRSKLVDAIDAIEETMFDELKVVAAATRGEAVESARRARARVRLLPGESGMTAVDLLATTDAAMLPAPARARLDETLRAWDLESVAALRSMKSELRTLEAERDRMFEEATTEVVESDGKGGTSVSRSFSVGGEIAERLQATENKIQKTRSRVADSNRRVVDGMIATLDGDDAAQRTLRRAFYRAANPSVYRTARDLEPFFAKAAAIGGLGDEAKRAVEAMRAEWIEAREARCEEYVTAMDTAARALTADPEAGMRQMQARMRERKKLREDLEQIEATIFRRLQEALVTEVGAEKAQEIGELPARRRAPAGTIQIGG